MMGKNLVFEVFAGRREIVDELVKLAVRQNKTGKG